MGAFKLHHHHQIAHDNDKCVVQRLGHLWQVQNFSHKVNSEFIVTSYEHSSKNVVVPNENYYSPNEIIVCTLIKQTSHLHNPIQKGKS
jgi:hypothetical protein